MYKLKLTLSLLIIILGFKSYSQNRIIQFQNISFEDGISDNRINNILQDDDGFIWFGTRLGIDRYDGHNATSYVLPNEYIEINNLIQDRDGRIWAATTGGLFYFSPEEDGFKRWISSENFINNSLNGNIVSIMEHLDGTIWCTNAHGAVVRLSKNRNNDIILHQIKQDEANNYIQYGTNLIQDGNGDIWIGTNHGNLIQYHNSGFNDIALKGNSAYINALAIDQNNQLWIGTDGNGLFKIDLVKTSTTHYSISDVADFNGINNNFILDILVDSHNNVWIGTDGGGLNLYVQMENKFFVFKQNTNSKYPIADNSILDIYQGTDNVIWVGTVHGGASYFKNHTTISHIPASYLAFDQIDQQGSRILEASNGDIWITAGRNGLRRFDPKTGKTTIYIDDSAKDNDLSGNNILALLEDDKKRIWIGTFNGGVNIYDPLRGIFLNAEDRYKAKAIFSLEKDAKGNVWVGTNSGIKVYNSELKIIETFSLDKTANLNSNFITCLYNDVKDNMWVGTNLGLNVFKKDTVISYKSDKTNPYSLSGNRVRSITEDDDLSVLIGTYGDGLNRYSRSRDNFTRIGKAEGLEANIIGGIFLDQDKNIWCSTNLGLSKINTDGTIENYETRHGVQSFSGGSAIISKSNHILMGGHIGLTYFKASELRPNFNTPPKTFFTTASVLGAEGLRKITVGSKVNNQIILNPDDNLLSIQFSSSDYWSRKKINFSYKLEGLNNEWQPIGNQQVLTFSNLTPGEYSLKVNSSKDSDQNPSSLASIGITVLPSFWQTAWVKVLIVLFGALLVVGFIKLRLSTIKNQRKKLQVLVETKTKEVKTQQEKIYQSEIALLKVEKEKQELSQKKLRDQLNFKTEELTNYTLRTVHKNHLLTEIKGNLLKETKGTTSLNGNLKKIIHLIDDSLMLDQDWENFYNLFNQIHTTFIIDLKNYCPHLSDREIRLCALIKLNFNSQHIATLFGISLSSVKVARHRLRKKLNFAENESYEDFFKKLA